MDLGSILDGSKIDRGYLKTQHNPAYAAIFKDSRLIARVWGHSAPIFKDTRGHNKKRRQQIPTRHFTSPDHKSDDDGPPKDHHPIRVEWQLAKITPNWVYAPPLCKHEADNAGTRPIKIANGCLRIHSQESPLRSFPRQTLRWSTHDLRHSHVVDVKEQ